MYGTGACVWPRETACAFDNSFQNLLTRLTVNFFEKILKDAGLSTKFALMREAKCNQVQSFVPMRSVDIWPFWLSTGFKTGDIGVSIPVFNVYWPRRSFVRANSKHGFQVTPSMAEIFMLLIADGITLLSTLPVDLQNQLNLAELTKTRGLKINKQMPKLCFFPKKEVV